MLSEAEFICPQGFDVVRYVSELCRSLHPDSSQLRTVAVLRFFADESGIHQDSPTFVLAGYVAPEATWTDFSRDWDQILKVKNGINVFDACDCNASEGEFQKFKGKRDERNAFVAELLSLVAKYPSIHPFYMGIVTEDYEKVWRPYLRGHYEHPYYAAMKWILTELALVVAVMEVPAEEAIACIFDRQKRFGERALSLFDELVEDRNWGVRHRYDSIAFASKRRFPPLQVAGALAYDVYHEFNRRQSNPQKDPRPSFQPLIANEIKTPPFTGNLLDAEFMRALIEHPNMFVDRSHYNWFFLE